MRCCSCWCVCLRVFVDWEFVQPKPRIARNVRGPTRVGEVKEGVASGIPGEGGAGIGHFEPLSCRSSFGRLKDVCGLLRWLQIEAMHFQVA